MMSFRLAAVWVLALALSWGGAVQAAGRGTESDPYRSEGPLNAWVTNGKWLMKVPGLRTIPDLPSFHALPWSARLGDKREQVFSYYERQVYGRKKHVVLARVELKSLLDHKAEIGFGVLTFVLRCDDGQQAATSSSQVQYIPWYLEGGLPRETLLNAKARAGGYVGFIVPDGCRPAALYFRGGGMLSKDYGETESLVIRLSGK